jgi:hypothetical protein
MRRCGAAPGATIGSRSVIRSRSARPVSVLLRAEGVEDAARIAVDRPSRACQISRINMKFLAICILGASKWVIYKMQ